MAENNKYSCKTEKKIQENGKNSHKIVKRLVLQFYDYFITLKNTRKWQNGRITML